MEDLLIRMGLRVFVAQIAGGIAMSQGEVVRPADLGLSPGQVGARINSVAEILVAEGNTAQRRARLVELIRKNHEATVGRCGLDETLESIRDEMRKFADS